MGSSKPKTTLAHRAWLLRIPNSFDFLATQFAAQKWSMKAMHRLIVTSATLSPIVPAHGPTSMSSTR